MPTRTLLVQMDDGRAGGEQRATSQPSSTTATHVEADPRACSNEVHKAGQLPQQAGFRVLKKILQDKTLRTLAKDGGGYADDQRKQGRTSAKLKEQRLLRRLLHSSRSNRRLQGSLSRGYHPQRKTRRPGHPGRQLRIPPKNAPQHQARARRSAALSTALQHQDRVYQLQTWKERQDNPPAAPCISEAHAPPFA